MLQLVAHLADALHNVGRQQRLGEGGDPAAQQCGWLADRYGVSWQVTPRLWEQFHTSAITAGARRAMQALMGMKKLDIAQLQAAFDGTAP